MYQFDKSHLSVDTVEDTLLVHRDYIAHCMRWTFVQRFLVMEQRWRDHAVLDIGCGRDLPLYKTICTNKLSGVRYHGVDVNKLELPEKFTTRKVKATLYQETDFLSMTPTEEIDLVTSFEMLEHVPYSYAMETLKHAYEVSKPTAHLIVSTPVLDPKVGMAKNHMNEMTREQMIAGLIDAGWKIEQCFGTFASEKDYKPYMCEEDKSVLDRLRKYYDSHYLATIFAPLYPEHARNNVWHCTKPQKGQSNAAG